MIIKFTLLILVLTVKSLSPIKYSLYDLCNYQEYLSIVTSVCSVFVFIFVVISIRAPCTMSSANTSPFDAVWGNALIVSQ